MQGRLVADGTPDQVAQDPQVLKHYLGMDFKTQAQADAQFDAQAKAKAETGVQTPTSAGDRHA
jgi:hypothetical protein